MERQLLVSCLSPFMSIEITFYNFEVFGECRLLGIGRMYNFEVFGECRLLGIGRVYNFEVFGECVDETHKLNKSPERADIIILLYFKDLLLKSKWRLDFLLLSSLVINFTSLGLDSSK